MEGRPTIFLASQLSTAFTSAVARSALGLVFEGVERPVSGSRDLSLDGMVGSL
jgi:hypothetical protein